jgi:CCR4-NOT transcriptional regulation complex NOT5 subunit
MSTDLTLFLFLKASVPGEMHIDKFAVETLFYLFYGMPRDELQLRGAIELHKRDWRYHKELKLWFARTRWG